MVSLVVGEQRALGRVAPVTLLLAQVAVGVVPFGLSVSYMFADGWSAVLLVIGILPIRLVVEGWCLSCSVDGKEHGVAVGDLHLQKLESYHRRYRDGVHTTTSLSLLCSHEDAVILHLQKLESYSLHDDGVTVEDHHDDV